VKCTNGEIDDHTILHAIMGEEYDCEQVNVLTGYPVYWTQEEEE